MSTNTSFPEIQATKSARSFVRLALPSFWSPEVSDTEDTVENLNKRQMRALFADDLRAGTTTLQTLRSA